MATLKSANKLAILLSGTLGTGVLARYKKTKIYIRKKYKDNKETISQAEWRQQYRRADQVYINMTQDERDKWRAGNWERAQSNYAKFMSCNLKRLRAGLEIIKIPPAGN